MAMQFECHLLALLHTLPARGKYSMVVGSRLADPHTMVLSEGGELRHMATRWQCSAAQVWPQKLGGKNRFS